MHLNASWKGEIQAVLPSDNLKIHLIWLISASILIISKTTLAEVLFSACPVFECRLQYSARNQSFIFFREELCSPNFAPLALGQGHAMLFWFGQGLRTESRRVGFRELQLQKQNFQWVLGCSFSGSADAHTFCVTLELVSTWVLRQLESSPWQWHFCLSWLNSSILFLLSIPRSLEAQLLFSISYLEGTHQCGISSWLVQNKVIFCFLRVGSF